MGGHFKDRIAADLNKIIDAVEIEGQPIIGSNRRIVLRRHRQRDRLRGARKRPIIRHHRDRAVARRRRIARVVVENALQDRLIGCRRGRARDRQHPRRGRVAHRQPRSRGRRRRRPIEGQRLHRIAIGPRR